MNYTSGQVMSLSSILPFISILSVHHPSFPQQKKKKHTKINIQDITPSQPSKLYRVLSVPKSYLFQAFLFLKDDKCNKTQGRILNVMAWNEIATQQFCTDIIIGVEVESSLVLEFTDYEGRNEYMTIMVFNKRQFCHTFDGSLGTSQCREFLLYRSSRRKESTADNM